MFTGDAPASLAGIVVLALTLATFWHLLPRRGRLHPVVGTEWEPYVATAVVFFGVMGLGFALLPLFKAVVD